MGTATATLSMCQWPSSSSSSSSSSLRMHVRFSCRARNLSASAVDKTLCQIKNSGVIACLRANSAEVAMEAANAAIAGGVSVLEIVMSTPGVFEVLEQLVKEHPTMALGVGTVLRIEDAKTAINAGAKFLMSPAIVKDIMVMDYIQSGEILYIPGTMTPTEILSASDAGAKIVKIYPVSALGGFQYISALKKMLLGNIFFEEHHQLFCQMRYLIERQLHSMISIRYINLHILLPCWVTKP